MSASGLHDLTSIVFGFVASIATGPVGGLDIPAGNLAEVLRKQPPGYEAQLQDASGADIGRVSTQAAIPVDLSRIPQVFFDAVLAAEDHRFMNHDGVDPFGLAAAVFSIATGGEVRGGSTVTQQMIKNRILTNDRTVSRKIVEAILALRAQDAVGRSGVMKAYLETAYFGRGETGVMMAPEIWFGISWEQMDLPKAALLAAMLKGPTTYDPQVHPERALARRNAIINRMVDLGWVTDIDGAVAQAADLDVIPAVSTASGDPWISARVSRDMQTMLATGSYRQDALLAETTFNMDWQRIATEKLKSTLHRVSGFKALGQLDADSLASLEAGASDTDLDVRAAMRELLAVPVGVGAVPAVYVAKQSAIILEGGRPKLIAADMPASYTPKRGDVLALTFDGDTATLIANPTIQGAVVIMDPRTGAVLASVGGYDAAVSAYDRTAAMRQPGSAIKPFLYLAALDLGISADSSIENSSRTFIDEDGVSWSPANYDHSSGGSIPLWTGLEQSSNLAAAHLIDDIGPISLARVAEAAGVYARGAMGLRLTASLGAYETTLSDLVTGYGAIVNGGFPRQSHSLMQITDETGATGQFPRPSSAPIAGSFAVADVLSMMRGVVVRGTAANAMKGSPVPVVGKTGTTQNNRDAWFVGVTPHVAVGVWLGRDNNQGMGSAIAGGTGAAPIAAAIFKAAHDADLIDDDGYRDDSLTSGLSWPPSLFERNGYSGSTVAVNTLPQITSTVSSSDSGFILEMSPAPSDRSSYYGDNQSSRYLEQTPIIQPGTSYFDQR